MEFGPFVSKSFVVFNDSMWSVLLGRVDSCALIPSFNLCWCDNIPFLSGMFWFCGGRSSGRYCWLVLSKLRPLGAIADGTAAAVSGCSCYAAGGGGVATLQVAGLLRLGVM